MPDRSTENTHPLLSVRDARVTFSEATESACDNVSFDVWPGEIVGIVGESGSGKSVTCRALMGMLPNTAATTGTMTFKEKTFSLSDRRAIANLRGSNLSMIFQDPMSALDPLKTIRGHIALRTKTDPVSILQMAGLPEPEPLLDSYAHQLSGGQCQRVAIGCALARAPDLLIADEPTTALDVTVQKSIISRLRQLGHDTNMAVLFVTHDLSVIYQICTRVLVMHCGRIVESGSVESVLTAPCNDYTKRLVAAIPRPETRGQRLGLTQDQNASRTSIPRSTNNTSPLLEFDGVHVRYKRNDGRLFDAVNAFTLHLHQGEILGLVGESGSGKSTVAKTAVGLAPLVSGQVRLKGEVLDWIRPKRQWRRDVQYIFQDPRGALDPNARIIRQICLPLDIHRMGARADRLSRAREAMTETSFDIDLQSRKPGALSGGQRQRATIARALALRPDVLICDESISALDVSIQARVLNLLMDLRDEFGLGILFISHDLGVVHHLCDRVAVMCNGHLVEQGAIEHIFNAPKHPYTQTLLSAVPRLPARPETSVDEPVSP